MLLIVGCLFFFKQKTAYEMRISDWSSDVCSSDLRRGSSRLEPPSRRPRLLGARILRLPLRLAAQALRGDQRRSRTVLLRRTRDPEARPRSQHGEVDPILGRRVWSDAASWRRDSGYRVRRQAATGRTSVGVK